MILNSPYITGSLTVTGNIISSGSITISGSIASASYALTASNALTLEGLGSASFAPSATFNTVSSSFASTSASLSTRVTNNESTGSTLTTASASFAVVSSSFATTSESISSRVTLIEGQYATTGSNNFNGNTAITGSLNVTQNITGSNILSTGNITAQTLVVQTVTSSIVYSSGSNIFGNQLTNVQQMTGSLRVTGSLSVGGQVTGSGAAMFGGFTNSANTGLVVNTRSTDAGSIRVRFGTAGTVQDSYLSDFYSNETSYINFNRNNASGNSYIAFATGQNSSPTESVRLTASGSLGIGTTTPSGKVYINGTDTTSFGDRATAALVLSNLNGTATNRVNAILFGGENGNTNSAAGIAFKYTSGTGNGLGDLLFATRDVTTDTAPTTRLTISSTGAATFSSSVTAASTVSIKGATPFIQWLNASDARLAYIQHNATNLVYNADTGTHVFNQAATFSSSVTAEGNISIKSGNNAIFYRPDNAIYTTLYDAGSGAANGFILNNTNGEGFHFKNGSTTIMRMPSNGYVGIGTNSPSQKVTIQGSGGYGLIEFRSGSSGTTTAYFGIPENSGNVFTTSNAGDLCLRTELASSNIIFGYSNAEKARITSAGKLQINTTTDWGNYKLQVVGQIASLDTIAIANGTQSAGSVASRLYLGNRGYFNDPATAAAMITSKTEGTFWYSGTAMEFYTTPGPDATSNTPQLRMTINKDGNIGAPSGTNIYNASDLRLKRNISTITDGLAKVIELNPVKFNWVENYIPSEENKDMLGFIAQEIQTVIPEAVETFASGDSITVNETVVDNPLRVNEKFIIPVLVKAIQEQQAQIEALKTRLETLENK